jgi:hypothetical protein
MCIRDDEDDEIAQSTARTILFAPEEVVASTEKLHHDLSSLLDEDEERRASEDYALSGMGTILIKDVTMGTMRSRDSITLENLPKQNSISNIEGVVRAKRAAAVSGGTEMRMLPVTADLTAEIEKNRKLEGMSVQYCMICFSPRGLICVFDEQLVWPSLRPKLNHSRRSLSNTRPPNK